jgi:hypothetical protein
MSMNRVQNKLEDRTALLGAGGDDRPNPLAPTAAGLAPRPLGSPSVDHHKADCLFGQVVGRLDARRRDEAEVGVAVLTETLGPAASAETSRRVSVISTCCRTSGGRLASRSEPPQSGQQSSMYGSKWLTASGGKIGRRCCSCPGCPPRFRFFPPLSGGLGDIFMQPGVFFLQLRVVLHHSEKFFLQLGYALGQPLRFGIVACVPQFHGEGRYRIATNNPVLSWSQIIDNKSVFSDNRVCSL